MTSEVEVMMVISFQKMPADSDGRIGDTFSTVRSQDNKNIGRMCPGHEGFDCHCPASMSAEEYDAHMEDVHCEQCGCVLEGQYKNVGLCYGCCQ